MPTPSRFTCALVLATALAVTAYAQPVAPADARRQVADMELHHGRLLEVFPALAPIDQAIRQDCAAHAPGGNGSQHFCKCAVAVVFGRWRANADPPVLKALQEVALKSAPHNPAEFVVRQGPEVYAELCAAAGR